MQHRLIQKHPQVRAGQNRRVVAAVSGLPSGAFAVVMYLVNIPLAFLVPSSSGHATLAMPIMAPLGDFAHVSRAMVVTACQPA